jgi:hypothetical protein
MKTNLRFAPAKFLALASAALLGASAHAANGITDAITAVDLTAVTTALTAVAAVIVAVALIFKGPAIAKRIIRGV